MIPAVEAVLLEALRNGHDVLAYGPAGQGGREVANLLGLQRSTSISGELDLKLTIWAIRSAKGVSLRKFATVRRFRQAA